MFHAFVKVIREGFGYHKKVLGPIQQHEKKKKKNNREFSGVSG
jgi:hypothetical protein